MEVALTLTIPGRNSLRYSRKKPRNFCITNAKNRGALQHAWDEDET